MSIEPKPSSDSTFDVVDEKRGDNCSGCEASYVLREVPATYRLRCPEPPAVNPCTFGWPGDPSSLSFLRPQREPALENGCRNKPIQSLAWFTRLSRSATTPRSHPSNPSCLRHPPMRLGWAFITTSSDALRPCRRSSTAL